MSNPISMVFAMAVLFWPGVTLAEQTAKLLTPGFEISIDVQCEEGVVECDKVRYRGISRKTGAALELRGRDLHTPCADGVTPCRFLGYRFTKGAITYLVLEDGDGVQGTLLVKQGEKVLVNERGTWSY